MRTLPAITHLIITSICRGRDKSCMSPFFEVQIIPSRKLWWQRSWPWQLHPEWLQCGVLYSVLGTSVLSTYLRAWVRLCNIINDNKGNKPGKLVHSEEVKRPQRSVVKLKWVWLSSKYELERIIQGVLCFLSLKIQITNYTEVVFWTYLDFTVGQHLELEVREEIWRRRGGTECSVKAQKK